VSSALCLGKKGPVTDSGICQILKRTRPTPVPTLHAYLCQHTFAHAWLAASHK